MELIPGPNGEVKVLRVRRETVPVGKGGRDSTLGGFFSRLEKSLAFWISAWLRPMGVQRIS